MRFLRQERTRSPLSLHPLRGQTEYADWKASLSRILSRVGLFETTELSRMTSIRCRNWAKCAERLRHGKKSLDDDYLKSLTPLSLALWYMDDGNFIIRSKGVQERTKDLSGRAVICVEAMEAGYSYTFRVISCRYLGHSTDFVKAARRRKPFWCSTNAETAKLQPSSPPRASEHGVQTSSSFRGQFAVRQSLFR